MGFTPVGGGVRDVEGGAPVVRLLCLAGWTTAELLRGSGEEGYVDEEEQKMKAGGGK
jgi:hypothetical protein